MTITLTPEIEAGLTARAAAQGIAPERLLLETLREEFISGAATGNATQNWPFEPQDEWERRLLGISIDCGVSLSNEAVSSEGLYE
jgi:hypothetical protein